MDLEKLVDKYISAWNRQDADGLRELCAPDASFYDTFWMERCAGQELDQYFRECFAEEGYWYQLIGDPILLENGVMYMYSTHESQDSVDDPVIYEGAELLVVLDDKIHSMTDYYWIPDAEILGEVARLRATRRGRSQSVKYGLPAKKASRFRSRIAKLLDQEKLFLDPNLTLSQVADRLCCSVDQLAQVISTHFGSNFYSLLDQHRASYARELLLEESDEPDYLYRVAAEAGFRSFERLDRSFRRFYDVTPAEFRRNHSK